MKNIARNIAILAAILSFGAISVACNGEANKKQLLAKEWTVEKIVYADGKESIAPENVYIIFADSGRLSGRAGCNQFMAKYTFADKDAIKITPGGMTMMYCPDMAFEDEYTALLDKVGNYKASATAMTLLGADKGFSIVYKPRVVIPATRIEKAAEEIVDGIENAAGDVVDGVDNAADAVGDAVEGVKKEVDKIVK